MERVLDQRFKAASGKEKSALLRVMAQRKSAGVDEVLKKALSEKNQAVRITAFELLGDEGGTDLAAIFLEASREDDAAVAKVARAGYLKLADRLLAEGNGDGALEMYHQALEFTSDGEIVRYWGDYSLGDDGFGLVGAIAVEEPGSIWVTDAGNNRVMHFSLP